MKHFTVPPFLGTGCVKKPRISTRIKPSRAFGLNSKKCMRRVVLGEPGASFQARPRQPMRAREREREAYAGGWGGGLGGMGDDNASTVFTTLYTLLVDYFEYMYTLRRKSSPSGHRRGSAASGEDKTPSPDLVNKLSIL